jgi:Chitin binding Peritrophin-A domain.
MPHSSPQIPLQRAEKSATNRLWNLKLRNIITVFIKTRRCNLIQSQLNPDQTVESKIMHISSSHIRNCPPTWSSWTKVCTRHSSLLITLPTLFKQKRSVSRSNTSLFRVSERPSLGDKALCPSLYGAYRSTESCSVFIVCVSGTPVKFDCPEGLNYNDVSSCTRKLNPFCSVAMHSHVSMIGSSYWEGQNMTALTVSRYWGSKLAEGILQGHLF